AKKAVRASPAEIPQPKGITQEIDPSLVEKYGISDVEILEKPIPTIPSRREIFVDKVARAVIGREGDEFFIGNIRLLEGITKRQGGGTKALLGGLKAIEQAGGTRATLGVAGEPMTGAMKHLLNKARKDGLIEVFEVEGKRFVKLTETGRRVKFPNPAKAIPADGIGDISKRFEDSVAFHNRGKQKIPDTIAKANQIYPEGKMSLETMKDIYPGHSMNEVEMVALIETVAEAGGKTGTLARQFLAGEATWQQFTEQLSTFAQIDPARLGIETTAGRTLRILGDPIVAKREYLRRLHEALGGMGTKLTQRQVADLFSNLPTVEQAVQAARDLAKPGWWTMFIEVRTNGLLSGPRTFAANAISNTAALTENIFERYAAEQLGSGAIVPGEAWAMVYGVTKSFNQALRLASMSFRGEVPDQLFEMVGDAAKLQTRFVREKIFAKVVRDKLGDFGSWLDYMETYINVPGRALMAADDFFKVIGYQAELHALARREAYAGAKAIGAANIDTISRLEKQILLDPSPLLKEQSREFAEYVTFTNSLEGKTAESVKAFASTPVGQFVVPFTRTPMNIAKFTLQRTPFARALPSVRKDLLAGGVRAELAKARMYTGSMMMASVGMLAYAGQVTGGGPTDPGLRRTLMLTGWQPYSIKIPGGWIEYNRLEPLGSIFGMAADFVEI
ncbi:hypothetical protein LCGC14_2110570, partial [marine sediment metagenome]